MIDSRIQLTVFHDADSTFTDHSYGAADFSRDPFSLTLNSATSYLYVGYYKPINALYFELATPNGNAASLTFEYYNGTAWTALTVRDETNGLTRSGFILWDRPALMASTTINSVAKFYVRCRPSATTTAISVRGLNLVFCDDNSLKQEFYEVDNSSLIPAGQSSHIMSHVAARNQIMQELRNKGFVKYNSATGEESLTQWDLLDIFETKEAAKYLALSKIFFSLSDQQDDNWAKKHTEYADRYDATMKALELTLDSDDDGVVDDEEVRAAKTTMRFVY